MNDSPTPDKAFETRALGHSVIPEWLIDCSYQQQSVILLALRGPDGVRKHHPAKTVHVAYRGTVLRAAERGRFLWWGEEADSFMSLDRIANDDHWEIAVNAFFAHVDELPHHYVAHLAHAAQIIGNRHPHEGFRRAWGYFYARWCDDLHVGLETETAMNTRLGDWGKAAQRLTDMGVWFSTWDAPSPNLRRFPEIYRGIARTLFRIALDKGGLDIQSEDVIDQKMNLWLAKFPRTFLDAFEPWLADLSEADLETMTIGGSAYQEEVMARKNAPPLVDDFLEKWAAAV